MHSMKGKTVTLDVREDIRKGREPFPKIMRVAYQLKDGETLRLIAPFEPLPLFTISEREGFSHISRPTGTGDWEVLFQRVAISEEIQKSPAPRLSSESPKKRVRRDGSVKSRAGKVQCKG